MMISPTWKISENVTRPAGRHGFTLLELLLAISLMGLMLGLSLPRIGAVKTAFLATEETEQLANAVRQARIEAISGRTTIALTTTADNPNCLLKRCDTRGDWQVAGTSAVASQGRSWHTIWDAPIIGRTTVSGHLRLESPVSGILFFADGTSTGGDILVYDTDGQRQHHLLVTATTGELFVQR